MNPRRLYRSADDRWIGGVAAGVADYFDIDPILVRIIWLVSIPLTGFMSLVAYFIMMVVVPLGPAEWSRRRPGSRAARPSDMAPPALRPPRPMAPRPLRRQTLPPAPRRALRCPDRHPDGTGAGRPVRIAGRGARNAGSVAQNAAVRAASSSVRS